jgi:hypothetical protein
MVRWISGFKFNNNNHGMIIEFDGYGYTIKHIYKWKTTWTLYHILS